jgi:hypothetical protein
LIFNFSANFKFKNWWEIQPNFIEENRSLHNFEFHHSNSSVVKSKIQKSVFTKRSKNSLRQFHHYVTSKIFDTPTENSPFLSEKHRKSVLAKKGYLAGNFRNKEK